MRIAVIDSWWKAPHVGSGTAVGISGLVRATRQLGHEIVFFSPEGSERATLLNRLNFNRHLPKQIPTRHLFDAIVGFDIDGFCLPRNSANYWVSIKGVAAAEALEESGRAHWFLKGLSFLERRNCKKAKGVITTSNYCRNAIAHHYDIPPENIRVVPEGIDLSLWRDIPKPTKSKSPQLSILCVARQYPRKRIEDLLEAFSQIKKKNS